MQSDQEKNSYSQESYQMIKEMILNTNVYQNCCGHIDVLPNMPLALTELFITDGV